MANIPYSEEVEKILKLANTRAAARGEQVFSTMGILEAMALLAVKEPWSWNAQLLSEINVSPETLLAQVAPHASPTPSAKALEETKGVQVPANLASQTLLAHAEILAGFDGSKFIETAHLMEVFVSSVDRRETEREILTRLEVTPRKIQAANERLLGRAPRTVEEPLEPGQKMAAVLKSMLGVEWDVEETGKLRRFFGLALAGLSPEQRALLKDMTLQLAVELGKAPEGMAQ